MSRRGRIARRAATAIVAGMLLGAVSACGVDIPADPDGTLDRIEESSVLRAGASASPGLVDVDGAEVAGPLPDLVEDFAQTHGATVDWRVDSEEQLVDGLETGRLDVAIGGMTDATMWSARVSVTRGYRGLPGTGTATVVFFMPLGENALQAALEMYLDGEAAR